MQGYLDEVKVADIELWNSSGPQSIADHMRSRGICLQEHLLEVPVNLRGKQARHEWLNSNEALPS